MYFVYHAWNNKNIRHTARLYHVIDDPENCGHKIYIGRNICNNSLVAITDKRVKRVGNEIEFPWVKRNCCHKLCNKHCHHHYHHHYHSAHCC